MKIRKCSLSATSEQDLYKYTAHKPSFKHIFEKLQSLLNFFNSNFVINLQCRLFPQKRLLINIQISEPLMNFLGLMYNFPHIQITNFLQVLQSHRKVILQYNLPPTLQHSHTNNIHILVSVFVGENVVPEGQCVEEFELLTKVKSRPAERIVERGYLQLSEAGPQFIVDYQQHLLNVGQFSLQPHFSFIELFHVELLNIRCYFHKYRHGLRLSWYGAIRVANIEHWRQNLIHALNILELFVKFGSNKQNSGHDIVPVDSIIQRIQPFLMLSVPSDHFFLFLPATRLIKWYFLAVVGAGKEGQFGVGPHGILFDLLPHHKVLLQFGPLLQILGVPLPVGEVGILLLIHELSHKLLVVLGIGLDAVLPFRLITREDSQQHHPAIHPQPPRLLGQAITAHELQQLGVYLWGEQHLGDRGEAVHDALVFVAAADGLHDGQDLLVVRVLRGFGGGASRLHYTPFDYIYSPAEELMFDQQSTSSLGRSINSFVASANLNPLASLHPSIISKIKKEVQIYQNASTKCESIWGALKKNSADGFHLSEKIIQTVFKQFETDLYNLTRITSLKEFMQVFDTDKDGILNEDQQIQIFCFIKERMERVANSAIKIQMYSGFKNLMREVRQLESNITKWQEHLRNKIHRKQLGNYKEVGQEKVNKFWQEFDKEFENLDKLKIQRREAFEKEALFESQKLQEKLTSTTEVLKIKPNKKIRDLQVHEKLISIEERIDEALDLRRELNDLQTTQKQRIDKLTFANAEHQRQNLRRKQQKGRKQLQLKLEQIEFKLLIRIKKQFQILRKKNHIHQNQIKRIQALSAKWAIKKGMFQPELKRTKNLEKRRNQIISNYKRVIKRFACDELNEDEINNQQIQQPNTTTRLKQSSFSANKILSCTTNFQITKKSQDLPVNKSTSSNRDFNTKISRYLSPLRRQNQISLCDMYDQNLTEKTNCTFVNSRLEKSDKQRRRDMVASKIF